MLPGRLKEFGAGGHGLRQNRIHFRAAASVVGNGESTGGWRNVQTRFAPSERIVL